MAQYRRTLRDWETERERQINEFTITDDRVRNNNEPVKRSKKTLPSNTLIRDGVPDDAELYTLNPEEKTYKQYKVE